MSVGGGSSGIVYITSSGIARGNLSLPFGLATSMVHGMKRLSQQLPSTDGK